MNTENRLNRAYAHWLEDGILEIGMGILLAGVGTLRAFIHFAGQKTAAYYWLSGGLLLFMIVCSWGWTYIIKRLKGRITYPRTGYTAFKPYNYNYKRILVLLIFAGILGGLLGILSTQPNEKSIGIFVPIGQGIVGAVILAYLAHRVEVKRFYYMAAIFIGIGMAIGALGVGIVLGVSFFYLCIGLALIVSGGTALVQYLRSHEPVDLSDVSL
jgi:MFS family permease